MASKSRACSPSVSARVCRTGESLARWRISSEYALPMPEMMRGSVRARLSVWFSCVMAALSSSAVQAPCDHQVDDQEQIIVELDHDALAKPTQRLDGASMRGGDGRLERADHEGAGQPHALERGAADARVERLDVDGDVGQLRHGGCFGV